MVPFSFPQVPTDWLKVLVHILDQVLPLVSYRHLFGVCLFTRARGGQFDSSVAWTTSQGALALDVGRRGLLQVGRRSGPNTVLFALAIVYTCVGELNCSRHHERVIRGMCVLQLGSAIGHSGRPWVDACYRVKVISLMDNNVSVLSVGRATS